MRRPLLFAFFAAVPLTSSSFAQGYFEARNSAMGGTGVASSRYKAAGFANPALLTRFGESDDFVSRKVAAVQKNGMTPILCVGETLAERESGLTLDKVKTQIRAALSKRTAEQVKSMVIAYEPIWAIGTGKNASPQDAQEVIAAIREEVAALVSRPAAQAVRIQYGGSVKAGTIAEIMRMPDIDGVLVGGASLDPTEFARIVQYRRHAV